MNGLLRQEIRDAQYETRCRVPIGADPTLERSRAVLAVLDSRKVALTESERSRILSASDEAIASRWLAKAATATSFAEVVGGAEGGDTGEDDRNGGFREGRRGWTVDSSTVTQYLVNNPFTGVLTDEAGGDNTSTSATGVSASSDTPCK